jgi:flagellar basal-body rod protein FlgB
MLEKTLAFTEARNRVLSENIANITTPGYRARQLDVGAFQAALAAASEKRVRNGGEFEMPATTEVRQDGAGHMVVTPSEEPVENLLFQDGTNARIERQMAHLAENTMMHRTASDLLQAKYEGVAKAIRGRMR